MFKVAGATVNQTPLDWKNNTKNIIDAIKAAQKEKVKILCLPELCITGYGCEDLFLSEWLLEKAWSQLLEIRNHCDNITVAVGLPVRIEGAVYNGAVMITNRHIKGIVLKQNLARDGVHYEPRWFDAWPNGRTTVVNRSGEAIPAGDLIVTIDGVRTGFEICEDAWRKDRPGYGLSRRGIDLILNPSASHFAMEKSVLRERNVVLSGSEMFNCVYVFANLLGNEAGRMIYDGDIVIAQRGRMLAVNDRFSSRKFNLLTCEVDLAHAERSQHIRTNDNKEKNEELTRAVSLGLFDYLRKSKARGFSLSLSGGADSATCAVMVAEMVRRTSNELGWEGFCQELGLDRNTVNDEVKNAVRAMLTCAYQSTKNSSAQTLRAAEQLAASIGAEFYHWNIDDEVASYTAKIETALNRKLSWETDDVSLQNIQARARSPIIWMLANIRRAILLTTSNRSEADVGYATMDGDTSGSLAPIAGLSKIFILQWLRWAEKELHYNGLALINTLQPTAELRPLERQQTDEADLMPYAVLAEIEHLGIYERKSPLQVYQAMAEHSADKKLLKIHVAKFFRLWAANQWKRERYAPAFHLDDLNVDPRSWCRFPILSAGFEEELKDLKDL